MDEMKNALYLTPTILHYFTNECIKQIKKYIFSYILFPPTCTDPFRYFLSTLLNLCTTKTPFAFSSFRMN